MMDSDSDLIIVDEETNVGQPLHPLPNEVLSNHFYDASFSNRNTGAIPQAPTASTSVLKVLVSQGKSSAEQSDRADRATRSSTSKSKPQPKLKFKLSEKAAAQAPGMSFLGPYDRELDSDDEDLAFEEQFILRMPPGEDCERLRRMVAAREISNDVWFKFKDSRRAIFHIGNSTYSSKLVDLPCIVESQKTLDNKQMFKVADICQMLVVENRLDREEQFLNKNFNFEEFIWPHGITPPLHHVRKRRFRKRVNKRTIESVEQEVERLLEMDATASQVQYEVLENVNPDLSDSEFIERDVLDAPTPGPMGSDAGDAPTPGADLGDGEGDDEEELEGDIDEELAAELDMALGDEADEEGEEEEEEEEEDSEEDDEDEDDEAVQARKILNEEIRDLEAAVAKKNKEIASSANPLIRKRFEDALKKLTADLEMKLAQRDDMKEKQLMKKEGIDTDEHDPDGAGNDEGDGDGDEDSSGNIFGSDGPGGIAMDIG